MSRQFEGEHGPEIVAMDVDAEPIPVKDEGGTR